MKSIRILVCIAWLGVVLTPGRGQEFAIRKVELTPDNVIIHYDLIDTTRGRQYTMRLYTSRDAYTAPMTKVSGDVGVQVATGANKKIVWSAKEELGEQFVGEIELEIRGRVYIPFLGFESFRDVTLIKRGQPRTITWTGGVRQNVLNFDLYNSKDQLVWTKPGVANDPHELELLLPTNIKPGKGYYFRVSDSKNKDQEVTTSTFEVRRKVAMLAKATPFLIVGTVLALKWNDWFGTDDPDVEGPPAIPN
jgi:hypothetical protein